MRLEVLRLEVLRLVCMRLRLRLRLLCTHTLQYCRYGQRELAICSRSAIAVETEQSQAVGMQQTSPRSAATRAFSATVHGEGV